MPIILIVVLAVLAAVVVYQLYAVLGRKAGRPPGSLARPPINYRTADAALPPPSTGSDIPGMDDLMAKEPGFDAAKFKQGAQIAYETVVKAFAAGERGELAGLVGSEVMPSFEQAIAAREAENRTERVEFQHAPRVDIQKAEVTGGRVRLQTRFLAEFRSRTTGPEGEAVDDRRTADLWTFERELGAKNPNWTLVRVDAAEA